MSIKLNYSEFSGRVKSSEIRELLKYTRKEGIISFAGGLPDPSLFPTYDIARITSQLMSEKGYMALQYGPTQGEPAFIEAIIRHMKVFREDVSSDQICVTSSSQQGLDLLSMIMLDKNSEVIMELPSYVGAIQAFSRNGAKLTGVSLEQDGMNLDELELILKERVKSNSKLSFIYTIPDYQNPAGITMSLEKRNKLLLLAEKYGIPVVEDSPYRELSFNGETLPSLWSLSEGRGVIQLKTLSKMLFPGMRLGWVVAPSLIAEKISLMKQSVDLCSPSLNQLIIARYINEGKMKKTIENAVSLYMVKNAIMTDTLEKEMPGDVTWSCPKGGMFLWLNLPERINATEMLPYAVEKNVVYVTGSSFFCDGQGKNTLRLNYSFPKLDDIKRGIEALSEVIRKKL